MYIYIYIYTHTHIHNHDKPKQCHTNHCNITANKRHASNSNSDNNC